MELWQRCAWINPGYDTYVTGRWCDAFGRVPQTTLRGLLNQDIDLSYPHAYYQVATFVISVPFAGARVLKHISTEAGGTIDCRHGGGKEV